MAPRFILLKSLDPFPSSVRESPPFFYPVPKRSAHWVL